MSDPSLALQGAQASALKADAALAGLINGRVYDAVPTSPAPKYPYVVIGEMQVLGVFRPAGSPAEAYYPDGTKAVY